MPSLDLFLLKEHTAFFAIVQFSPFFFIQPLFFSVLLEESARSSVGTHSSISMSDPLGSIILTM